MNISAYNFKYFLFLVISAPLVFLVFTTSLWAQENQSPPLPVIQSILSQFETIEELEEASNIDIPDEITDINDPELLQFIATVIPPSPSTETYDVEGTVSCFDYYEFGSVDASINSEISSTVNGVPMTFNVLVTNNNDYPIINGDLYVKVFREQEDDTLAVTQGGNIIDQFYALRDITLDKGESTVLSFVWNIPSYITTGDYYIATFFASQERYNLLGLSFTDDIIGGTNRFHISSEVEGVYFDKTNVTLNGNQHRFIGPAPRVEEGAPASIKATILNDTTNDTTAEVTWTLYKWDALHDENFVEEERQTITIPAQGSAIATYEAEQDEYSVYMATAELQYKDAKSYINVRYVRAGVDIPRINFPGITKYPLEEGEQQTLFACLHNTGTAPIVENGELTLRLADEKGREIHTYVYEGPITGAMMGVKDDFTPQKTSATFSLLATLKVNGETIEEVETLYNCDDINRELCPTETNPFETLGTTGMSIIALVLILLLGGGLIYTKRRNGNTPDPLDSFAENNTNQNSSSTDNSNI